MSCSGCAAEVDCVSDPLFPYSITSGTVYPFVEDCPAGYACGGATTVSFLCCNTIFTATRPANATAEQLSAIYQSLITQCRPFAAQCGLTLPPAPSSPFFGTPTTFYSNQTETATVMCQDGLSSSYSVPAGSFASLQPEAANTQAAAYAKSQAGLNLICMTGIPSTAYTNYSFNQTVSVSGTPTLNLPGMYNGWSVVGSLPPGLSSSLGTVGTNLVISGTPSATGNYSFALKFVAPGGQSRQKTFPMTVFIGLTTPSLSATAGNATVGLSWNSIAGATTYTLYRGLSASGPFSTTVYSGNSTSHSDNTVSNGTTYYYVVVASNTTSQSPQSNVVQVTPSSLVLSATFGDQYADLSWTAVPGASSYTLLSGTYGGPYNRTVYQGSALGFPDNGLINGVTYNYIVIATLGAIQITSNPVSGIPEPASPALNFNNLAWDNPPDKLSIVPNGGTVSFSYTNSKNTVTLNGSIGGALGQAYWQYGNTGYLTYTGPAVSCNMQIVITNITSDNYFSLAQVYDAASGGAVYASELWSTRSSPPSPAPSSGTVNVPFTIPESTNRVIAFYVESDFGPYISNLPITQIMSIQITPAS